MAEKTFSKKHIQMNLIKDLIVWPVRFSLMIIVAGILVAAIGFGTRYTAAGVVGIVFLLYGVEEYLRLAILKKKLNQGRFEVKRAFCKEKTVTSSAKGTSNTLVFQDGTHYNVKDKESKIWKKAMPGELFYLVRLDGKKDILKIYPGHLFHYDSSYDS